ncbi:MAG: type I glutamate--ammonia ligase [Campylobacterota bacterium]|nr:type I glutamate--ammonia ligase [Campylobacterota bacterium]
MGTFVNNTDEFYKYCENNEVEFVDFRFTDINGGWHHINYRIATVEPSMLDSGLPFDGSSIDAWQPIEKSDMILKPDIETAFLDPFTKHSTIIVICDVYDIYKDELYAKCPRSIAKKTLKHMEEIGIGDEVLVGPENEFFVFDDVRFRDDTNSAYFRVDSTEGFWNRDTEYEDGNIGHRPGTKGGYFPTSPTDSMVDLRDDMMLVLEKVGLTVMLGHHEVAQAQGEIGIKYATLIEAADNVQKYKYVVKMVADQNGKTATFMPKPLVGDNGNGMHVHQSIWKDGKNLFYKEGEYANLSETALHYLGGVFKHAHAISAFTNPTTNSYKRLVPGYEAPSILTYSSQNRSAACRIPYGAGEMATRIETRFPDSTACPYLAFSALMLAGLDGIKNKYIPVGPMDTDLFELTLDEIREKKIPHMPRTLREALEGLFEDHEFLLPVMTKDFLDTYRHHQFVSQVHPDEARPTAFQFISTYSR